MQEKITKILITGANSYIGTSFENYINKFEGYQVDTLDVKNDKWKEYDFSDYDVVFNVAGIAHSDNGKISEEKKKLYYNVNTNLTVKLATKAKAQGVKQFIYMSSMIVYGESAPIGVEKMITRETVPKPANAYGDSKLQADKKLEPLNDDSFNVVILRPPMIYGVESRGNYPVLAKYAKKLPVFPNINNRRSMLYVENLCEFIRLMIKNKESGIFFPQNEEYISTSNMVALIAEVSGNKLILIKLFNGILKICAKKSLLINKVFGNNTYHKEISNYKEEYRIVGFKESIIRTERGDI